MTRHESLARGIVASSAAELPAEAILEIGARLRALGFDKGKPGDRAALVFVTTHLARDPEALAGALEEILGGAPWLGFVGATAWHDARLRERRPALTVLVLEGVRGHARSLPLDGTASDTAGALLADMPVGRARFMSVAVDAGSPGNLLDFLPLLDEQDVPLAGSISIPPGGERPAVLASPMLLGPAVGLLDVDGIVAVTGVAQATRALGPARTITSAAANAIRELEGRPAVEALLSDLPSQLRSQVQRMGGALCAGFGTGDEGPLLMRGVVGLDPTTGALAVAGQPRVGQRVTFALKDAAAARADLDHLIDVLDENLEGRAPLALIVFGGVARDEGLFQVQNHDVQRLLARFGTDVPIVGVAGGGEVCTTTTGTHVLGMTAVVVALVPVRARAASGAPPVA